VCFEWDELLTDEEGRLKKIIFNKNATPMPTNFTATRYNVAEKVP